MNEIKGWYDLSIREFLEATQNHDGRPGSRDDHSLLCHLTDRSSRVTASDLEIEYQQTLTHLNELIDKSKH